MNIKGFTTVEMVLTMVLVVVIMSTITTVTLVYRDKSDYEEILANTINYKNTVTKIIYDDILDETNPVTAITYNETSNQYTFQRVTDSINLSVIESNSSPNKVAIKYNDVEYIVPDSNKGMIDFLGINFSNDNNIYVLDINFESRKLEELITIHLVVSPTV